MKPETYRLVESYMLSCMDPNDCAHSPEHVYRVLHAALDIADHEENVNLDVLICACLLHDVGRQSEIENPSLCHAQVGAEMARAFLRDNGFSDDFADHAADCIRSHRYRKGTEYNSIESRILFDADKLDVSGAMGIARTIAYNSILGRPLYTLTSEGNVDTRPDADPSFVREYNYKLRNLYDRFHTARAAQIARERQEAAVRFYESFLGEIHSLDSAGKSLLEKALQD